LVPIFNRFGEVIEVAIGQGDWTMDNTLEHPDDDKLRIKAELEGREWDQPFNRYDNIFISMMTFFEISTLEMWPDMMFSAIDAVGYDLSPKEKKHTHCKSSLCRLHFRDYILYHESVHISYCR